MSMIWLLGPCTGEAGLMDWIVGTGTDAGTVTCTEESIAPRLPVP